MVEFLGREGGPNRTSRGLRTVSGSRFGPANVQVLFLFMRQDGIPECFYL
jgi:hypothetical protein